MKHSRREGEARPEVSGFTDPGSQELMCKALSQECAAHRISIGVFRRLPLAPRVATLILIYFICELRVTRICLCEQAVGKACVTREKWQPTTPAICNGPDPSTAWMAPGPSSL